MQTVVRFSKCKQSYGTKKSLHKQTGKALPSREASSSVLCSDSICSKTAPIALNALRIELKYRYHLFFCIQLAGEYSMGSRRMSTDFTMTKHFQQSAIERGENFGKTPNATKYRDERRGGYTFAPQRAKGWQTGANRTICQPFFVVDTPRRGISCAKRIARNRPIPPPSPSQRYNTLDFASKVVCHETLARFLWILPAAPPQGLGKALPNKYDRSVHRDFNF